MNEFGDAWACLKVTQAWLILSKENIMLLDIREGYLNKLQSV